MKEGGSGFGLCPICHYVRRLYNKNSDFDGTSTKQGLEFSHNGSMKEVSDHERLSSELTACAHIIVDNKTFKYFTCLFKCQRTRFLWT